MIAILFAAWPDCPAKVPMATALAPWPFCPAAKPIATACEPWPDWAAFPPIEILFAPWFWSPETYPIAIELAPWFPLPAPPPIAIVFALTPWFGVPASLPMAILLLNNPNIDFIPGNVVWLVPPFSIGNTPLYDVAVALGVIQESVPLPVLLNTWPLAPCVLGYVTTPAVIVPLVLTFVTDVFPNWILLLASTDAP